MVFRLTGDDTQIYLTKDTDVRDTWTTPQIEGVAEAILSGEVLAAAESAVGALK